MKQLGNLAIISANRRDVVMKVVNGEVIVIVGIGYAKTAMYAKWNDDAKINGIIHELNYGQFKNKGVNTMSDRVKVIRETYKPGTRVLLISMSGESQMPEGLEGFITGVDDWAQLHCSWSNGSSLALNIDEDVFVTYSTPDEASQLRNKLGLRDPGTEMPIPAKLLTDGKTEYTNDESREGHCLRCGNELHDYGTFEVSDDCVEYPWKCSGCGSTGREHGIVYFDGHYVDLSIDSEEK